MGGLQTALNQLSWGDEDVIKVNERITFVHHNNVYEGELFHA